MPHQIKSLHKNILLKLKALYTAEEASALTDRLFEHFFDLSPAQRVMSGSATADEAKISVLNEAVVDLLSQIPLQYVLGTAYFMDMELDVNPSVLIPRPETEELVSLILKELTSRGPVKELRILEIGTGSGCIAIALKRNLPGSLVSAVDISADAICVAAANAQKYKAEVSFIRADILDRMQWELLPQSDLMVSNPPYVTHSEKKLMLPNVLDHEPHLALFVPDEDPLVFYRCIADFAKTRLSDAGSLWFEINEMFGKELRDMVLSRGFEEVNIIFDFRGKSRFLQCFKMKHYSTSNHTNK